MNQGYGGNQKIGYQFAIQHRFDFVALIHGDGQYAPECLPDLVRPLRDGEADAVFGSRMLERAAALRGGMPLYKFIGNRILTWFENRMLGAHLSEFHSGYRVYSVAALEKIPFHLNTNDFHFDTEIIIQLFVAGLRIKELPIPTYYGDEICHVNGLKYAGDVTRSVLMARSSAAGSVLRPPLRLRARRHRQRALRGKAPFPESPHGDASMRSRRGPASSISAAPAATSAPCSAGCGAAASPASIAGRSRAASSWTASSFTISMTGCRRSICGNTTTCSCSTSSSIWHRRRPSSSSCARALALSPSTKVIASTANIGFIINRLMLLVGQFNYGKRGILDLTHSRLFTFRSFRRLFEQSGFRVLQVRGIPGPFPLVLGNGVLSRAVFTVNDWLIRLVPGLFSYQMFFIVESLPSLEYLLREAHDHSAVRSEAGEPQPAPAATAR